MDRLDELIKQHVSRHASLGQREKVQLPDEALWHRYFADETTSEENARILELLKKDPDARAFVVSVRQLLPDVESVSEKAPEAWVTDAKRTASTQLGTARPKKKDRFWVWYAVSALTFCFSFVFARYYMQFLAVTVLAGIKGIFEQRQAKTQILIYKALEAERTQFEDRLKELDRK